MTYIWSSSSGRIELAFSTLSECQACSHSGRCDADVSALANSPAIAAQLSKINPAKLANELREYGAWDEEELLDHSQNLQRLVWIATNDVAEQPNTYLELDHA